VRTATTDTQYRLGSITKTFTAAALMQLLDAGKLDVGAAHNGDRSVRDLRHFSK